MTNKEKAIRWFENISDECDKLTSGNVAHLKAQIKGMAIRSAEYLTKHSQPASEDLEQEIDRFFNTEGIPVTVGALRDTARHFAQWQKEQMMRDAIDAAIVEVTVGRTGSDLDLLISIPESLGLKDGDEVKVIINKE